MAVTVRRVSIPVDPCLSWVVPVPEALLDETRPASPRDARRVVAEAGPGECPGCSHFVERAMRAIALALDDADAPDGDWPPFEGPTD